MGAHPGEHGLDGVRGAQVEPVVEGDELLPVTQDGIRGSMLALLPEIGDAKR
jgi:hypothetical protein